MSSGGNEYVDDNYRDSGHSPFTYFLINELQHNDKPMITLSELSTGVTKAVANNVDQTPTHGVLQGSGDELGEFIFVKIKVKVKGISPDKVKVDVDVEPDNEGVISVDKNAAKPQVQVSVENAPAPKVDKSTTEPAKAPTNKTTKKADKHFNPLPLPSL